MAAITVGSVAVDVVPSTAKFWSKFKAETAPQAAKLGDDLGEAVGKPVAEKVRRGVSDGLEAGARGSGAKGAKAGDEYGSRFGETVRKRVEAALKALPDAKIGADASEVDLKLAAIRKELATLRDARIGIDVDEGLALAQLERMRLELEELGRSAPTVQARFDSATAAAEIAAMQAQVDKLGASRPSIKVDADAGAAATELAAVDAEAGASTRSVSGLVAAGLALGPALVPAAAAATAAIAGIGVAAIGAASGLGVMFLGFSGVVGAVKAMSDGQHRAGQEAASLASRQNAVANAADQVRNAEVSLSNAQATALRAQQDLTRAREEALRAMEDLNTQVADGALAQRQANLDVQKAKQDLDQTLSDPTATRLQRAQARLTYDQAVQQVQDLDIRQKRLVADQQAATKAGVEGSQQVTSAQRNVLQAQQQVESATRALAAAHRAQATAAVQAASAGGSAIDTLREKMAALSPAGRDFATFIFGLRTQFQSLQAAAQGGLLPGVQAGIQALLPFMPQLRAFVADVSSVLGELFQHMGQVLAGPFWQQFFAFIARTAPEALRIMGGIIENLVTAFAGLLEAFAPLGIQMGQGLLDLTKRFADWAKTLKDNPDFQKFIAYVRENGPILVQILGNVVVIVGKLAKALAPLGSLIIKGLGALTDFLAKLSPGELLAIATAAAAIGVALGIAFDAIPLAIGLVVAAIALLVGSLVYAFKHVKWFHDLVVAAWDGIVTAAKALWKGIKAVWDGISTAISWTWHNIIEPVVTALVWYWQNVLGPTTSWLYEHVMKPAWEGIRLVIEIAWAAIRVVFGLIEIYIKAVLAPIFTWLYEHVIKPAWEAIASVISSVWNRLIKPVFSAVGDFLRDHVLPVFRGAVEAIGKAWDRLRELARKPVEFVVNSVVNPLIRGYNDLARIFHTDQVATIPGFAVGGYTGDGGKYAPAGIVHAGEYVIPAEIVAKLGVRFFDLLIGQRAIGQASRYPGDGSGGLKIPGYASGGLVGDVWSWMSNPSGALGDQLGRLLSLVPGAGLFRDVVVNMGRTLVDGLVHWVTGGSGVTGDIPGAQHLIRSMAGKPYLWAAASPYGADCSGAVSIAYNYLHGKNPWAHTFSTRDEGRYFPIKGHGVFTAGWSNPGEGGPGGGPFDVGHTAANLAGLAFESRGGDGWVVGSRVTPLDSFAHVGHYDSGGWLMPGLTIARNDTGRPERILTADQWAQVTAGRTGDEIHLHGTDDMLFARMVAHQERRQVLARVGRPA